MRVYAVNGRAQSHSTPSVGERSAIFELSEIPELQSVWGMYSLTAQAKLQLQNNKWIRTWKVLKKD